jgi:hypothetical protein
MQFRPKSDYPTADAATSDQRKALASAINERDAAARALDDAKAASERARDALYAAEDRAADLRKEAAEADRSPDEVVAALSSGGDIDILSIERPRAESLAQIEVADEKVSAWRRAVDLAEGAVPVRERAVDIAEGKVKQRAAEVFATQIDVPKMLAEAQVGADWIVARRAVLMHLRLILPDGEDERAIEHFLSRPWLLDEHSGDGWKRNPAIAPLREAFERLQVDAEAVIEASS